MIINREFKYIILVLFLPFQFQFLHDFYLRAYENVKSQSDDFNVPFSITETANRIFFVTGTVASVISVFVYYKLKKKTFIYIDMFYI